MLLRPYRRVTQLGGKDGARTIATGSWHRNFFRDMREASKVDVADAGNGGQVVGKGTGRTVFVDQGTLRPEARLEDPSHSANRPGLAIAPAPVGRDSRQPTRPDGREPTVPDAPTPTRETAPAGETAPARTRRGSGGGWTEPDVSEQPSSYAIYRPETGSTTAEPAPPRIRSEAK